MRNFQIKHWAKIYGDLFCTIGSCTLISKWQYLIGSFKDDQLKVSGLREERIMDLAHVGDAAFELKRMDTKMLLDVS